MREQDHRIHNQELAHHMAVAEDPYQQFAHQAAELGLQHARHEALSKANQAAITIGREYLNLLGVTLDSHDTLDQAGGDGEYEILDPTFVTKEAYKTFCKENGYTNMAASGWNDVAKACYSFLIEKGAIHIPELEGVDFATDIRFSSERVSVGDPGYTYRPRPKRYIDTIYSKGTQFIGKDNVESVNYELASSLVPDVKLENKGKWVSAVRINKNTLQLTQQQGLLEDGKKKEALLDYIKQHPEG